MRTCIQVQDSLTGYGGRRRHVGAVHAHVVAARDHAQRPARLAVATRVRQLGHRPYFGHAGRITRQHYPRVVGTAHRGHGLLVHSRQGPGRGQNARESRTAGAPGTGVECRNARSLLEK